MYAFFLQDDKWKQDISNLIIKPDDHGFEWIVSRPPSVHYLDRHSKSDSE